MKVVNILIISLLLVFLEIKYSTAFSTQSLIGSITHLFQTPIHCCLILYFSNATSQFEFNEVASVPLYLMNTNAETGKIQTASKLCKNHIFILNSFNDLKEIKKKDNLVKGDTGQYAFIIQKSNPEAISRMNLKEYSFFDDILNFMIIVPGSGTSIESTGTYLFYHKNLGHINDSQITMENIWKNGSFLTTFSKDFMKFPLTGRHLKVTSWEYAIYLYMENGKYQGFEVSVTICSIYCK